MPHVNILKINYKDMEDNNLSKLLEVDYLKIKVLVLTGMAQCIEL